MRGSDPWRFCTSFPSDVEELYGVSQANKNESGMDSCADTIKLGANKKGGELPPHPSLVTHQKLLSDYSPLQKLRS
jgi:hypothetical protein